MKYPIAAGSVCRMDYLPTLTEIAGFLANMGLIVAGHDCGTRVAQIFEGHLEECEI